MRGKEDIVVTPDLVFAALVLGLPLALLLGAVLLRAAVSLANRCLPPAPSQGGPPRPAIPVPGLGRAALLVFVNLVVGMAFSFAVGYALEPGEANRADAGRNPRRVNVSTTLVQLVIGFLVNANVLCTMLPTSFGRACLVCVCEYVILLGICFVVAAPLVVLAMLVGGP